MVELIKYYVVVCTKVLVGKHPDRFGVTARARHSELSTGVKETIQEVPKQKATPYTFVEAAGGGDPKYRYDKSLGRGGTSEY